jgi:hypothetical protein
MSSIYLAARAAENLRRWNESGQPRQWVEARPDGWDHAAWEALLRALQQSEYWPVEPEAVGRVLDELSRLRGNLRRWLASGQARRWVEYHAGRWGHDDWAALVNQLRYSEFWPVELADLGQALERLGLEWRNLRRWRETGDPRRWVMERRAHWDHADWQQLVETLRRSRFWPLDLGAVGCLLEELKQSYWNVYRWRDSGQARRWLQGHGKALDHAARLALFDTLSQSEYWPMDPAVFEQVMAELEEEARNLRQWEESGAALRWVEEHQGQWTQAEWHALLADLERSAYWPLDVSAVGRRMQEVRQAWWNLERWKVSGLARRWVEAHQGEWTEAEWEALLDDLQKYHFWPIDPAALGQTLEEMRADWWRLRPWLHPGQALRSAERRRDREELRRLLDALHHCDFWPSAPAPAREPLPAAQRRAA